MKKTDRHAIEFKSTKGCLGALVNQIPCMEAIIRSHLDLCLCLINFYIHI